MQPSIEVTDRDGWRKEFPLLRNLVMVGSDLANDIPLPESRGQGAEPRHLQILLNPQDNSACRVINMAKSPVEITIAGQVTLLAPSTAMVISMESALRIGDYRLQLHGFGAPPAYSKMNGNAPVEMASFQRPAPTPTTAPYSPSAVVENRVAPAFSPTTPPVYGGGPIGLAVRMSQATLTDHQPAEAFITVANRGEKTAVQIRLLIEGLPSDSYEIPPLPLLFPNAEKSLTIQLRYPNKPLSAGSHPVRFLAVAPEAYPNEQVVVQQSVVVPSVFAHEVKLRGPL
jgi:hypothetical protein